MARSHDIFLFAIEQQMASTIREIDAGCQPHSKAIFSKRDELLKAELAMLFRGQQGVFRFLDHCWSVLKIVNENGIKQFFADKLNEGADPFDQHLLEQNQAAVCESMVGLFQRLTGIPSNDVGMIMSSIEEWTSLSTKPNNMKSNKLNKVPCLCSMTDQRTASLS